MRISTRLGVALAFNVGLIGAIFSVHLNGERFRAQFEERKEAADRQLGAWIQLESVFYHYVSRCSKLLLWAEPADLTGLEENRAQLLSELARIREVVLQNTRNAHWRGQVIGRFEREQALHEIESLLQKVDSVVVQAMERIRSGRTADAYSLIRTQVADLELDRQLFQGIQKEVEIQRSLARMVSREMAQIRWFHVRAFAMLSLICLIGVTLVMIALHRSLLKVIRYVTCEVVQATGRLSRGDLEARMSLNEKDEFKIIESSFNQMASELSSAYRKLLEQEQKMVYSSRMAALGEMGSGMAHEINNPLAVIVGKSEQLRLRSQAGELDLAYVQRSAEVISNTAQRISRIITALRTFAAEQGNGERPVVHVDVLFEETLAICQERFRSLGVSFMMCAVPDDLCVRCNAGEMRQALLNLLNNAYEAAMKGPEPRWIRLEMEQEASDLIISVTDSGPGVSEEIEMKIFQPFFTTKEVGQGTGLGLSIARGLIEQNGGKLTLDRGHPHTRFSIRIARSDANGALPFSSAA